MLPDMHIFFTNRFTAVVDVTRVHPLSWRSNLASAQCTISAKIFKDVVVQIQCFSDKVNL